jgi:hypothetical protein
MYRRGVDVYVFQDITRQVRKPLAHNTERVSQKRKLLTLTRLASGFVNLLAKPEFYSHLASW